MPTQITVNGKVSLLLRTRKSFDNYSHIFFHKMEESKDILCRNQDEGVLGMLNSPVVFISCVFLIACTRLAVSLLNSALKERLLLLEEGITRDKFKVLPQKSTLNNIMEFMDWPVYLTFPESTPIYQCRSNGHILCSVCLPNLETCRCPYEATIRTGIDDMSCLQVYKWFLQDVYSQKKFWVKESASHPKWRTSSWAYSRSRHHSTDNIAHSWVSPPG